MSLPAAVVLMYHRVGKPVLADEGDYALPEDLFERHLGEVASRSRPVVPLGALALGTFADGAVALTFDDGYDSDFRAAAPLLRTRGFPASFFVSAELVGTRGFATWPEVRSLADEGFLVGSHGLDHTLLDDLGDRELRRQLVESKARLEQALGRAVSAFALPGGSGGERARRQALDAGYTLVLGSRPGVVRGRSGPKLVPRFAMRRHHEPADLAALLERRALPLLALSLRHAATGQARRLIGDKGYARLRQLWLDSPFGPGGA